MAWVGERLQYFAFDIMCVEGHAVHRKPLPDPRQLTVDQCSPLKQGVARPDLHLTDIHGTVDHDRRVVAPCGVHAQHEQVAHAIDLGGDVVAVRGTRGDVGRGERDWERAGVVPRRPGDEVPQAAHGLVVVLALGIVRHRAVRRDRVHGPCRGTALPRTRAQARTLATAQGSKKRIATKFIHILNEHECN